MTPITNLGWIMIAISLLVGIVMGSFIYKRFPNLFSEDRKMKKVMKNPHLLMEKLQAQGKIYDQGKYGEQVEIGLKVELDNESGKEVLMIERKPNPNLEEIKKRLAEKKEGTKDKKAKKKKIAKPKTPKTSSKKEVKKK